MSNNEPRFYCLNCNKYIRTNEPTDHKPNCIVGEWLRHWLGLQKK